MADAERIPDGEVVTAPRPVAPLERGDRVVVIGAGPAGLTAAYLLVESRATR